MKIYLDDNHADKTLAALLRKDGHTVVEPGDVGKSSASDARHLEYAILNDFVVLTADRVDFRELHDIILAASGKHPGIVLVRYDNDPTRDMKPKHIVRAIRNIEKTGFNVESQLVVLNQWR